MAEGEDAGGSGLCCAGGDVRGVLGAVGELGGGAVPPSVGHHCVVGVHHGRTPRGRRVGVGATEVLDSIVGEGENAGVVGLERNHM